METKTNTLEEVLKDTSFEDHSNEVFDTAEECIEYLQERIYEEEVIYYHTAMKYLMEHDDSLNQSIALAMDQACDMCNVNSELLATLLLQQNMQEELAELTDEIEECFE